VFAAGETHVYAFDADHMAKDLDALEAVLSIDERERAGRFVEPPDRRRFIAGRALLRRTLADYTGVEAADIRFEHAENGKPALAGAAALRFSVSGSESLVLVALRQHSEVGVDIECVRPVDDRIAQAAMTADELARHEALPGGERERNFFSTWVAKEAVSKALGRGLRLGFADFACPPSGGRIAWPTARAEHVELPAWVQPLPVLRAGYAAAVAFTAEPAAIRLWSDLESRMAT
jgi:4'-phosphopantetheinyl transferase